ncbi:MAG: NAD-dependent epimerase/dehydratase family protein, partial [Flavobacteriales bacterium]
VSNYAYSKYYAEQEVWRASSEGLDVVILNPSIILGPGNWNKGSSKIFQTIYNGLKFYTSGKSGYVDVADVAKITLQFLSNKVKNERYILNGTNISFKEAFNKIADEFGKPRATIRVTPFLKEIAWRLSILKSFFNNKPSLITRETANSAMKNISYSSSKIKNEMNYKFISFNQTIKKYCKFYEEDLI